MGKYIEQWPTHIPVVSCHLPAYHTMSSSDSPAFMKTDRSLAESILSEHGLEFTSDGQLVRWQRGNKEHPRNWPLYRRVFDITVIYFFDLFLYVATYFLDGVQ